MSLIEPRLRCQAVAKDASAAVCAMTLVADVELCIIIIRALHVHQHSLAQYNTLLIYNTALYDAHRGSSEGQLL